MANRYLQNSSATVLAWTALTKSYASYNRARSLKRILGDCALRYLTANLKVPQLQYLLGTTFDVYKKWAEELQLPLVVDELGEDARLLWIGPKRLDRVLLFCHGKPSFHLYFSRSQFFGGGGYLLPAASYSMSFWRHVQLELEKRDIEVGIALLQYCTLKFHLTMLCI